MIENPIRINSLSEFISIHEITSQSIMIETRSLLQFIIKYDMYVCCVCMKNDSQKTAISASVDMLRYFIRNSANFSLILYHVQL